MRVNGNSEHLMLLITDGLDILEKQTLSSLTILRPNKITPWYNCITPLFSSLSWYFYKKDHYSLGPLNHLQFSIRGTSQFDICIKCQVKFKLIFLRVTNFLSSNKSRFAFTWRWRRHRVRQVEETNYIISGEIFFQVTNSYMSTQSS